MNYEKASDFEINKAVAEALGYETGWKAAGCARIGIADGSATGRYVDYCNNPADAWPIIAENKINIDFQYGSWPTAEYSEYIYTDENPLRAAMIVFLMIQDHKEMDK